MDIAKLTPAPWRYELNRVNDGTPSGECDEVAELFFPGAANSFLQSWNPKESDETALEFTALARNAIDVIIRRGGSPLYLVAQVMASATMTHGERIALVEFVQSLGDTDAFTALVEADKWLTERAK